MTPFRLGTRKSPLAQAQTDRVLSLLPAGLFEKALVESEGDLDLTSPIQHMDRPGAFTSVLTDAILAGRIDAAVHSLKDLPLQAPADAPVVAVLPRDSAADAMVVRADAIDDARPPLGLKAGARLGTSAPRRQSQALAADPEVVPVDVRGNVGTRLNLVARGVVDALLMAEAAFERMPLPLPEGTIRRRLDPHLFPTGPGQGAIAVQARVGTEAARLLAALDHAPTRGAVELERRLLGRLGGGCGMPLGTHAERVSQGWRLSATLASEGWESDPRPTLARARAEGADPESLLRQAHDALLAPPAPRPAPPAAPRILALTLAPDACAAYEATLAEAGWRVVPWDLIETPPTGEAPPARADVKWLAVASPRGAPHAARWLADRRPPLPRVAALGPATARALRALGLPVHVVSPGGTGQSLADAIAVFPAPPGPVLLPQARAPTPELAEGLSARGFEPVHWAAYDTRPRRPAPALPPGAEAVVLTSPSNVEAYLAAGAPPVKRLVAFGPTTETAMRRAGLPVHGVAPRRSPAGILEALP